MCMIVDVNSAADLCQPQLSPEADAVIKWVETRGGQIVHGGQLTDELSRNGRVRRWLRTLGQAGRARQLPAEDVTKEAQRVQELGECVSDDFHIVALARISGARLLFSRDQPLHADFTNRALIDQPRGKVYQGINHRHLLDGATCGV